MEFKEKSFSRRDILGLGAAAPLVVGTAVVGPATAESTAPAATGAVVPPEGRRILVSCKLSMIANEIDGHSLSATERLSVAGEAGFDGVDFDEAGNFSPTEVRDAVMAFKRSGKSVVAGVPVSPDLGVVTRFSSCEYVVYVVYVVCVVAQEQSLPSKDPIRAEAIRISTISLAKIKVRSTAIRQRFQHMAVPDSDVFSAVSSGIGERVFAGRG